MSRAADRPPRVLRWLAAKVVSRRDRDDLLTDLDECFAARRQAGRAAVLWYLAQAAHAGWTRRRPQNGGAVRGTVPVRLQALWADLRYAMRRLGRERAFTTAAVATLALSTGPAIAAFSLANWFYVRPMPGVTRPEQLAAATFGTPSEGGITVSRVSYAHLDRLVAMAPSVAGITGWQPGQVSLSVGTGTPRIVPVEFVTGNFFDVLGVRMHAGRPLHADDDRSPFDPPVAVLSYSLARTLFPSRDPIGQTMRANGHPVRVVGVAPRGFSGNRLLASAAMWLPGLATPRMNHAPTERWVYAPDRGPFYMHVVRLEDGATLERAELELTTAALALADEPQAQKFRSVRANLRPGFAEVPVTFKPIVGILLGVGVVLVLLGVANLTNLFAFRGLRRAHEGAIRRALGASTSRIAQVHLMQTGVVALAGCLVGAALASLLTSQLNGVVLPPDTAVPLDWRVATATLGLSFMVTLLLGSAPARMAARLELTRILARTGRGSSSSSRRGRTGLAVVQVVLSLTLFAGALLFTTTLRNLRAVDLGFQPRGVSVFQFGFGLQGYFGERKEAFYRDLLTSVRTHPDVTAAAVTADVPLFGGGTGWRIAPMGKDPRTEGHAIQYTSVTDGYFDTIGIAFVAGRPLRRETGPGFEEIVITESLAERLFGTRDAAGRMASFPASAGRPAFDVHVVGVTRDVRFDGVTEESLDLVYRPFNAGGLNDVLLVRSSSQTSDVATVVRRAAAGIDPALPITFQMTMEDVVDRHLGSERLFAWTSSLLAALGFLLAAIGIYGLLAQAAAERTREFGIRLALGAERRAIRWLILRSALIIGAIGIPVGIALATGASRLVASQLYGVTADDPGIYVIAACALGVVTIGSGAVPAWAAARANPADIMRVE
jgi:predicted permease